MKTPDREQWRILQAHTSSEHLTAPTGVVLTAASLVRGETDLASHSSVQTDDESTTWTFDIVVGGLALAHAVIHYDKSPYDQADELQPFGPPPTMTVKEAWVRKLKTVTAIEIAGAPQGKAGNEWYAAGKTTLKFAGDVSVALPDQDSLYSTAARDRSDEFHNAIRDGAGF